MLLGAVAPASAQVITFEGAAPPGGQINPLVYTESGFNISGLNTAWAIFDAASPYDMPGNSNSSFLGWGESNVMTLVRADAAPFLLESVLIGRSTIASGPATTVNITGNFVAGGPITMTYPGLATATLAQLNWTGLTSVQFSSSDDAAMDNLVVPAPGATIVLGGMCALGALARRRR
jgi:hypothetical protein